MRLIDLDKVKWQNGFYDMHTGEQFAPMMFNTPEWLEWATAEAEVDAVPIERIKEWIKTEPLGIGSLIAPEFTIEALLYWWEKENGTQVEHKAEKKGKWIIDKDCEGKTRTCTCSICGYKTGPYTWENPNFCANCGADMRG